MANPAVDNTPAPRENCSCRDICARDKLACKAFGHFVTRGRNFMDKTRRPTRAFYLNMHRGAEENSHV